MVLTPDPPLPRIADLERVYMCRRLDYLHQVIVNLERQAAVSPGMRAQRLLDRADKHRQRAERIRAHLRARGV